MLREIQVTPMADFMVRLITITTKEKFSFEDALHIVFTEFAIDGFSPKYYREIKKLTNIFGNDEIIGETTDEFLHGVENAKLSLILQDEVIRELSQNYTRETYNHILSSLCDGNEAMLKKFEELLGNIVKLMSCGYPLDHILIFFLPPSFTMERGVVQTLSQGWHDFMKDLFDEKFECKVLLEAGDVLPIKELAQDAKIDMFNGAHTKNKQQHWTMLDAMIIIAGRLHNRLSIEKASAITGIPEEEILRHINKHRVIRYD